MFNNNDDRFLVLLQTKDTPHIEPIYPVSYASLGGIFQALEKGGSYHFRAQLVREEDITMFSIYELTFSKYKTKAIELSDTWAKLYSFRFISNFVDIALYFSSYKKELKYFGSTITNNKPKYFINSRDDIFNEMASKMSRKAEITFDGENVYINKKAIIFKKEKSITKDIFILFFSSIKHFEHKISFQELEKSYHKNIEKYSQFGNKTKFNYQEFRKLIDTKNKEIKEKNNLPNFLGIDVEGIECRYYFGEQK